MSVEQETIDTIIHACRVMEIDHDPEGWPAIQMYYVTALCDEIELLREQCNGG